MTYLLDSSILVAAIAEAHPNHMPVVDMYNACGSRMVYDHSLFEAYRVLTFPNRERGGYDLAPLAAANSLKRIADNCMLIGLTPNEKQDALFVYASQGVISARIYDAMIGYAGVVHNADAIITLNARNFRSLFPKLKIIDPSQPAESLS
jgi:predicted nucleic acid-binding protein